MTSAPRVPQCAAIGCISSFTFIVHWYRLTVTDAGMGILRNAKIRTGILRNDLRNGAILQKIKPRNVIEWLYLILLSFSLGRSISKTAQPIFTKFSRKMANGLK